MGGLSTRDYERMLDLAAAVMDTAAPESPWPLVAEELARALGGTMVLLSDVNGPAGTARVEAWAPEWVGSLPLDRLLRKGLDGGHPLPEHYARTGDQRPLAVTDVAEMSVWRRTEAYATLHETVGVVRHIAIPLPAKAKGQFRTFVVHRDGGEFDDRERSYVRRMQPLLVSVDRFVRQLTEWAESVRQQEQPLESAAETKLTPREIAVLSLLADGMTAEAIGRRLGISNRTVHKHTENLYRKLSATDRLMAVLRAQGMGLLPTR
ncbi:LuxR C-terminal-related transcriptional regulator [Kutzneria sp. NPDC051319]|uniref:helix-turn-helix transcriptional regulator n=1 Tax=Kutzneria sp. NPDC051319 TaxID=3155047 RepID=UPI003441E36E